MPARGGGAACPLLTSLPCSSWEAACPGEAPAEIRAYKLGRSRWSYNQIELKIGEQGGSRRAVVRQAAHSADAPFPPPAQDSAVCFHLQLETGQQLKAHIYIVYDGQPAARPAAAEQLPAAGEQQQQQQPEPAPPQQEGEEEEQQMQQSAAGQQGSNREQYEWQLVLRQHCCKGCQGCLLRSIQRFGRLGKRSWSDAAPDSQASPSSNSMKDPRFMYLSLDEACTHVDAAAFRLVIGIYNESGSKLLGTGVSPPVRVLANNDVPTGAARIPLEATLPADWEGWANMPATPVEQDVALLPAPVCPPVRTAKRVRATPRKPRTQAAKPEGGSGGAAEVEGSSSAKRRPKAAAGAPAGNAAAPAEGGSLAAYSSLGTATESLTEQQGSTPRVVVLSQSAWKAQQQQSGPLNGMPTIHLAPTSRAGSGRGTRSISLPSPAATAQRPQSHWQVQQQRMAAQAGSGGGTPTGSGGAGGGTNPGMFAARTLASSGPSASQQPSPRSASPHCASLAGDISPFALAAAQASQAMAERGSNAWPHLPHQQQQQQQQQQQPSAMAAAATGPSSAGEPLASPRLDPLVGASVAVPSRSPREQQWVAYSPQMPTSLPLPVPMLPTQLGGSDASSALYYPGPGLPDRAALLQRQVEAAGFAHSAAAFQAAQMGHGMSGPAAASHPGVSPRTADGLSGMVPTASMGPSASASSNGLRSVPQSCTQLPMAGPGGAAGMTHHFSSSPDIQALQGLSVQPAHSPTNTAGPSPSAGSPSGGDAARQALLLQHAEAQMLAASRAAASRHARMATAFHAQLPEHLQLQQAQQAQQAQHSQQAQQAHLYLAHLQAQQAQQATVAAQQAATMVALQRMAAAHRLLPFPAAPTPLGPPPSIPDAGGNPKAATGAASPAPHALQQQVGGGAGPEFDGMRLMMTSPAGFGSLLDVGNIFDDLLP